jgi:hypothetical protein
VNEKSRESDIEKLKKIIQRIVQLRVLARRLEQKGDQAQLQHIQRKLEIERAKVSYIRLIHDLPFEDEPPLPPDEPEKPKEPEITKETTKKLEKPKESEISSEKALKSNPTTGPVISSKGPISSTILKSNTSKTLDTQKPTTIPEKSSISQSDLVVKSEILSQN